MNLIESVAVIFLNRRFYICTETYLIYGVHARNRIFAC